MIEDLICLLYANDYLWAFLSLVQNKVLLSFFFINLQLHNKANKSIDDYQQSIREARFCYLDHCEFTFTKTLNYRETCSSGAIQK